MRNTVRSKPAAAISLVVIPSGAAWRAQALRERWLREGGFSAPHIAKFLLLSALHADRSGLTE